MLSSVGDTETQRGQRLRKPRGQCLVKWQGKPLSGTRGLGEKTEWIFPGWGGGVSPAQGFEVAKPQWGPLAASLKPGGKSNLTYVPSSLN